MQILKRNSVFSNNKDFSKYFYAVAFRQHSINDTVNHPRGSKKQHDYDDVEKNRLAQKY